MKECLRRQSTRDDDGYRQDRAPHSGCNLLVLIRLLPSRSEPQVCPTHHAGAQAQSPPVQPAECPVLYRLLPRCAARSPRWLHKAAPCIGGGPALKRPRFSRKFEGGKQAPLYVCCSGGRSTKSRRRLVEIAHADALACLAPRGRSGCVVCASGRAINNQVASCDFACRATPCARTHGRVPHALNAVKTGGHGAARCAAHAAARCGWSAHDPPRVSVAVYMYLWSKPVCGRGEPGRER